jgi:hypothetical protein
MPNFVKICSYDVAHPDVEIPDVDYSGGKGAGAILDAVGGGPIKVTRCKDPLNQWEIPSSKTKMVLVRPPATIRSGCQELVPLYKQGVSMCLQDGVTCVEVGYQAPHYNSLCVEVVRIGSRGEDEGGDKSDETARPFAGITVSVSSAQAGCGSSRQMQGVTNACGEVCFENLTVGTVYKVSLVSTPECFGFEDGYSDTRYHRLCADPSNLQFRLKRLKNTVRLMILNRNSVPYNGAVIHLCDGRRQLTETADESAVVVFADVRAPGVYSIDGTTADGRKLRFENPQHQVRCGDQAQQVFANSAGDPGELRATMTMSNGMPAVGRVQLVSLKPGSDPIPIAEASIEKDGCVRFPVPELGSGQTLGLLYRGKVIHLSDQQRRIGAAGADSQLF